MKTSASQSPIPNGVKLSNVTKTIKKDSKRNCAYFCYATKTVSFKLFPSPYDVYQSGQILPALVLYYFCFTSIVSFSVSGVFSSAHKNALIVSTFSGTVNFSVVIFDVPPVTENTVASSFPPRQ